MFHNINNVKNLYFTPYLPYDPYFNRILIYFIICKDEDPEYRNTLLISPIPRPTCETCPPLHSQQQHRSDPYQQNYHIIIVIILHSNFFYSFDEYKYFSNDIPNQPIAPQIVFCLAKFLIKKENH
ncbi:hypothetical protein F8M41_022184 [Gigaspora margarita]|uniref:Uncharacterized protein n=1 Tax=Gigaspora margarita TaxID=4874 RepID=A0A8H4AFG8_GIGMA|nr:hypothetical protein F8M41_022184 [Gigaspora margarita]